MGPGLGRSKRRVAELIAGHTGQSVEQITTDFDRHRRFHRVRGGA